MPVLLALVVVSAIGFAGYRVMGNKDKDRTLLAEGKPRDVSFSCRYFSIFIHVHKLSPALTSVVGRLEPNSNKRIAIELKASDKLKVEKFPGKTAAQVAGLTPAAEIYGR